MSIAEAETQEAAPTFDKPFTQQEPIPEQAIARAAEILRGGRLHRYNVLEGEEAEASLLERDYAAYQEARYCLACTSGGTAIQIALRAAGVRPGDAVLANAFTLAPVPGAMHAVGGRPVLVEIDENYVTDLDDLVRKAEASGARFFLISHMRGHIADMDRVAEFCRARDIVLIEDCAHTMGARWNGVRSGNHGRVACFSTQTYKHLNSGEGGLLTTDDAELAARAIVMSGSYMLYERHGMTPDAEVFERVKLDQPNLSSRMDNLRAAILRGQLPGLERNVARWNALHDTLAEGLADCAGIRVPWRDPRESYVGSSFQFSLVNASTEVLRDFIARCGARGVELKWFGAERPAGFTSRYDSWRYLGGQPDLPKTRAVLATLCDLRLPLTFDVEDAKLLVRIIREEAEAKGR